MLWPMRPLEPVALPREPTGYWFQIKHNGWNLVLPGDGTAWTRRGNEITDWGCFRTLDLHFPFPLNAELMVRGSQVPTDVPRLKRKIPLKEPFIVVHDAMIENTVFETRQLMIADLGLARPFYPAVNHTFNTWACVNRYLDTLFASGHEGLVLKKRGSHYLIGKFDSVCDPVWIKLKTKVAI